mmetsp:Transcript_12572/g.24365  ORF Transcript_12572/g.24365 Transcript_12572/m.24365 type:complete len:307 (-) Transcript_12572:322-1242(-)
MKHKLPYLCWRPAITLKRRCDFFRNTFFHACPIWWDSCTIQAWQLVRKTSTSMASHHLSAWLPSGSASIMFELLCWLPLPNDMHKIKLCLQLVVAHAGSASKLICSISTPRRFILHLNGMSSHITKMEWVQNNLRLQSSCEIVTAIQFILSNQCSFLSNARNKFVRCKRLKNGAPRRLPSPHEVLLPCLVVKSALLLLTTPLQLLLEAQPGQSLSGRVVRPTTGCHFGSTNILARHGIVLQQHLLRSVKRSRMWKRLCRSGLRTTTTSLLCLLICGTLHPLWSASQISLLRRNKHYTVLLHFNVSL